MSGHSKWHSIKRKKGAADAKRGAEFTRLANAISIAAKDGADPEMNFKLRLAIDKAKSANMPNANIEKSIARGSGQLGGAQIQEVVYEGYGPGGVAVIVECATDNKNRTLSDVRNAFNKGGGNMAESGAVAFQFSKKGIIVLKPIDKDASMLNAIDAGVDDIEEDEGTLTLYTSANQLNSVRSKLQELGELIESAELAYVPTTTVPIIEEVTAQKIVKLIDALEELDDVSSTTNNADIDTAILERL